MAAEAIRTVEVAAERLSGWLDRFGERHGEPTWHSIDGAAEARAADGAIAVIRLALPIPDPVQRAAVISAALDFDTFGLVLVRRGGFSVGLVRDGQVAASRTGTRYVQGQTKAGGQSQKRYARRRANQAAALVRSAADAVDAVLGGWPGPMVCGGDRALVRRALDAAGSDVSGRVVPRWLDIGNPRRRLLDEAVAAARAARIDLNALA